MFEPVSEYLDFSKSRLNSDKFTFNNVACSDREESLELFIDSSNLGWNTFVKEKTEGNMSKRHVPCIRVSDYIKKKGLKSIDAIKIDVEGHEYYILKDLATLIETLEKLPVIFVEIGWGKNNPVYNKLAMLMEKYYKMGYAPVNLDRESTFDIVLRSR